jgi:alkylation response protein AidB-like acyl-CoA dehydrogenase
MACAKIALGNAVKYAKERRQFGRAIAEFGLIKRKIAEMSIRCFVGDAMVYRALGDVDRALEVVSSGDTSAILKTIEGFAVECSINKVYTSEALAWVVDEALQVFGGNGYSREFPAERAYRDARITRIYEGTNEINRLIIPTRLLKQGLGVREAGPAARDRAPATRGAPLETERALLDAAKRLALGLLGEAAGAFGDAVRDEQEVLADIADVVIDVYATESTIARAEKLRALGRGEQAGLAADVAQVHATDAADRMSRAARQVARALSSRGQGAAIAELVTPIAQYPGIDGVAARRRIADATVAANKHPF